jgi:hypothetical protein
MARGDDEYCPIWEYFNAGLEEMGLDNIHHEYFDFYIKLITVIGVMEDKLSKSTIDKIVKDYDVNIKH